MIHRPDDPAARLDGVRVPSGIPKPLSEDQIASLLDAVIGNEPIHRRDRALLELLYATGARVSEVVGCPPQHVIDFYGLVENIGVVYPDCAAGNKHVPRFADVTVRDPLRLAPVDEGETGIVQVGSLLPTSFPGHMLLTDDLARVVSYDGCACGRRGVAFQLAGRVAASDIRGCGNTMAQRQVPRRVA